MKKRILAIFLCLILAVSLAAAVAAENNVIQPGGTYIIVPDNPSQPGPDDTPVPNDTTMTLEIPIEKHTAFRNVEFVVAVPAAGPFVFMYVLVPFIMRLKEPAGLIVCPAWLLVVRFRNNDAFLVR